MGLAHHDRRWWPVRTAAVRRDDFKCQECGARGPLEVHHIVPAKAAPELAYDLANVATLCRTCHIARHGRDIPPARREWRDLLQKEI